MRWKLAPQGIVLVVLLSLVQVAGPAAAQTSMAAGGAGPAAAGGALLQGDASPPGADALVGGSASAESQVDPTTAPADRPAVAWPLFVLAVGILVVLGLIIGLKVNAFLALITAAVVVSLMAEGALADKIARVASAFEYGDSPPGRIDRVMEVLE